MEFLRPEVKLEICIMVHAACKTIRHLGANCAILQNTIALHLHFPIHLTGPINTLGRSPITPCLGGGLLGSPPSP